MERASELEWLKWFYDRMEDELDNATEVIEALKEGFVEETQKKLPEMYDDFLENIKLSDFLKGEN